MARLMHLHSRHRTDRHWAYARTHARAHVVVHSAVADSSGVMAISKMKYVLCVYAEEEEEEEEEERKVVESQGHVCACVLVCVCVLTHACLRISSFF